MDENFDEMVARAHGEIAVCSPLEISALVCMVRKALNEPEFVEGFERMSGLRFLFPRSPIEAMIDQATGHDQVLSEHNERTMAAFIATVWETVYRRLPAQVTASILEAAKKDWSLLS